MKQLTEKQALAIAESDVWKNWTDEEVVKFQLFQERLCMNFSRFHSAIEKVLSRPVFTHEFAFPEYLRKEYLKEKEPPSFGEILGLIPKNKLIGIVVVGERRGKRQ